ncbi:Smr/MutS family protein [Nitratidesulfovibrio sp. HK-II]|uniref:Smr/MutS family protein n=1 Tax=Nitratidesulfovibrio sp. HK-II TaxID=2009266 RepID=UPI000E2F907C|nr:Smr/MutS family protein [Nitratidesulfovibrio sp. HK-II]GBO96413.1 Smr family protein [Nitratidesulfovibrio sp. HK-II]
MADTHDDDFDSTNPFRSLNKRAFRDARTPKTTQPAPSAPKAGARHGGGQKPPDEALSSEDAEAFLFAMGTVQRLEAPKKPAKGKQHAQSTVRADRPDRPDRADRRTAGHPAGTPSPAAGTTTRPIPVTDVPVAEAMPGATQPARTAPPTSTLRAAERDKLASATAARLDADAARNGFALQDQPGFKRLLERGADTPENTGTSPVGKAPDASAPGKPAATPVTASERKEAVRQRSREAVADHEHTPPPDEDNLFSKAMSGVRTLAGKGREVPPETAPREAAAPAVGHPLQDFMDGAVEFALEFTDEYLEGHVVGLDALTVGKLRAGQYSPEGHLDLHGMNALQAYEAMIGFMRAAYHKGMRTVLVIPGRGRNSPDGMGVLREKVQAWLTHDPFKRVVLAFCTAQPAHGGAGALYVLLRKYKKSRGKVQWDRTPTDADLFL